MSDPVDASCGVAQFECAILAEKYLEPQVTLSIGQGVWFVKGLTQRTFSEYTVFHVNNMIYGVQASWYQKLRIAMHFCNSQ